MFTCSICDESFCKAAACTTLCGHVFHSGCISKWLERKKNCPQCRSTVLEKDLVKLFLEDHSSACILQNDKLVEELNILKNQLKNVTENKKQDENLITQLQNEQLILRTNAAKNLETSQFFHTKYLKNETLINDLSHQLASFHIRYKKLQELNINVEKNYELEQIKYRSLEKDLHEMKSANSIAMDKLNSEIADLKSDKAYLQDKCHSLEKLDRLPSTSKVIIKNENTPSLNSKIPRTFFGHDPNLKFPSKKFLLGCTFLFIGDPNQYEDICSDIFMLKLSIVEHGGSVELEYSSRITHLICATRNHHLVDRSLRDGIRCVTSYWLSDIIAKELLLPPWLAYHFPLPYSDENNLPCQKFQIAIINFNQNEYCIVNAMVKLTGAQVVDLISSNTDVVVSMNLNSGMIDTAYALKKPVVNVQWLNDILFGAFNGIKAPQDIKYQQFNSSDPFLVNYDMVSVLMEAWKFPVVFLQDNKVHDLTDCSSSADSSICKRQKINFSEDEVIDLVDDEDSNDLMISSINIDQQKKPCVLFCGFETKVEEELKQMVLKLGGEIGTHCLEGTHLVMNKPSQTQQFLSCLTTINYIIDDFWIRISYIKNSFEDEKKYVINKIYDNYDGVNCKIVCNVLNVLQNPNRQKLFEHKIFYITPGIEFPSSNCLEQMITSAGGTVLKELQNLHLIEKIFPNTYFIISCIKDFHLIKELLEMKITIYKSDFITNAIMEQRIRVNQNHLLIP